MRSDLGNACGQVDPLQRGAVAERLFADRGQALRKADVCKRGAPEEGIVADALRIPERHLGKRGALVEGIIPDGAHACGKMRRSECAAAVEGAFADALDAVAEHDVRERRTLIKGALSHGEDIVAEDDALQGAHVGECVVPDGGDALSDDHGVHALLYVSVLRADGKAAAVEGVIADRGDAVGDDELVIVGVCGGIAERALVKCASADRLERLRQSCDGVVALFRLIVDARREGSKVVAVIEGVVFDRRER